MDGCRWGRVVIIKLGGSVLVDDEAYRQAARFLVSRLHECSEERFLTVVSAQNGHTDELEKLARGITRYPDPRTVDLLWATGEMRSVALLTLHLEELGVRVVGLNIHEMGLHLNEAEKAGPIIQVVSQQIKRALEGHSVVVVPVLLADEFDAGRCELIKDVEGYFTEDPDSNPGANYLPWISYETAVEMAERGCGLVQRVALEAARQRGLQLVVRNLDRAVPGTVVSSHTN